MNMFQGRDPLQGADRGCELQDRRVQGVAQRQGLLHRVRAPQLQRHLLRRPLQAAHRTHAPDQGPPPIPRRVSHALDWST